MKTPKKVWKDIAGKLRNKKGTTTTDMETPADVEEVKVEIKKQTSVDKATETDTQLCEDINENSEEAQNDSTTVGPTSVDRETSPSLAEPCSGSGNTVDERPSAWQRQAIVAGVIGAALLVGSVAFYVLKIHVTVAVVVGIVGLACIGLALYNITNPNTKLEKVKSVEQPVIQFPLNPT